MSNPAFIVEGRMEQMIIKLVCPGKPVVLINCNGDNVPVKTVARFIDIQARILRRYDPKIVICDREGRSVDSATMAKQIKEELLEKGSPGEFIVGVADREFENWILAGLQKSYTNEFFHMKDAVVADGCYGKTNVRKCMTDIKYQTTTHGPILFEDVTASHMAKHSPSAARFIEEIKRVCGWASERDIKKTRNTHKR